MKLIIAGSRTFCRIPNPSAKAYVGNPELFKEDTKRYIDDFKLLSEAVKDMEDVIGRITEVVSGDADGADKAGEKWAKKHRIPVKKFKAQWWVHGKSAGYKRNIEMADYADAAIIFIRDNSKGANHMLKIARQKNLRLDCFDV